MFTILFSKHYSKIGFTSDRKKEIDGWFKRKIILNKVDLSFAKPYSFQERSKILYTLKNSFQPNAKINIRLHG
jgi:hypothetical protein